MDASTGSSAAVSTEVILRTRPGVFRAALRRISRDNEPARWAVENLKLGARLRAEAAKLTGAKRTRMLQQVSKAFEEAVVYFCGLLASAELQLAPAASDAPPASSSQQNPSDKGIELVLDVVLNAEGNEAQSLKDALELFSTSCTDEIRATDFREWLAAGLNRGCALILMAKLSNTGASSTLLHLAVDACYRLLGEPVLRDLKSDCALVYINLAEALKSLSDRQDSDDDARYLESSTEALAMALWQTVPDVYRGLVAPKPEEFN